MTWQPPPQTHHGRLLYYWGYHCQGKRGYHCQGKYHVFCFVLILRERERESSTLLDSIYCIDIFGCIYGHLLYRLDWDYARLYFLGAFMGLFFFFFFFLHIKLNNNTSWLDNHRHKHIMAACFTTEIETTI